jgi:hypothetical protein
VHRGHVSGQRADSPADSRERLQIAGHRANTERASVEAAITNTLSIGALPGPPSPVESSTPLQQATEAKS